MGHWILESSIVAAAFAGIVWIAISWLQPAPATRHLLWSAVLLRLVLPPVLSWNLPTSSSSQENLMEMSQEPMASTGATHTAVVPLTPTPVEGTVVEADPVSRDADGAWEREFEEWFSEDPEQAALPELPESRAMVDGEGTSFLQSNEPIKRDPETADRSRTSPIEADELCTSFYESPTEKDAVDDSMDAQLYAADVPTETDATNRTTRWTVALATAMSRLARLRPARVLLALWVLGTLLVILRETLRVRRVLTQIRRARPASRELRSLVERVATALDIRAPTVLLCTGAGTPFVFGPLRPVLMLPMELAGRLSEETLEAVVTHELAHLRRRDHILGCVLLALGAAWWWHPLFPFLRRQIETNAELACDSWVTWRLPRQRRTYASCLLALTTTLDGSNASRGAAPSPALGMALGAPRFFERRLRMILGCRFRPTLGWPSLLAVLSLSLLAHPGWTQSPEILDDAPASDSVDEPPTPIELKDELEAPDDSNDTPAPIDDLFDPVQVEAKPARPIAKIAELVGDTTSPKPPTGLPELPKALEDPARQRPGGDAPALVDDLLEPTPLEPAEKTSRSRQGSDRARIDQLERKVDRLSAQLSDLIEVLRRDPRVTQPGAPTQGSTSDSRPRRRPSSPFGRAPGGRDSESGAPSGRDPEWTDYRRPPARTNTYSGNRQHPENSTFGEGGSTTELRGRRSSTRSPRASNHDGVSRQPGNAPIGRRGSVRVSPSATDDFFIPSDRRVAHSFELPTAKVRALAELVSDAHNADVEFTFKRSRSGDYRTVIVEGPESRVRSIDLFLVEILNGKRTGVNTIGAPSAREPGSRRRRARGALAPARKPSRSTEKSPEKPSLPGAEPKATPAADTTLTPSRVRTSEARVSAVEN